MNRGLAEVGGAVLLIGLGAVIGMWTKPLGRGTDSIPPSPPGQVQMVTHSRTSLPPAVAAPPAVATPRLTHAAPCEVDAVYWRNLAREGLIPATGHVRP